MLYTDGELVGAARFPGLHDGLVNNPVEALLNDQSGVVTRAQLRTLDVSKPQLDRMIRRRELVRLLPGVFVNHTGEPTWIQRAWAGTLFYAPAALGKTSALRAANGPGWRPELEADPIIITVGEDRHVQSRAGYLVCRQVGFDQRVLAGHPPRVRIEQAVLDVAAEARSTMDALEAIAEACRSRRTTPGRLLETMGQRKRLRRRTWLAAVLHDVAEGTSSVLEHDFVHLVERRHGLPTSLQQAGRAGTLGRHYDDVRYAAYGVAVELDGALFHASSRQRDRDLDRDLDAAVDGRHTIRLGWGQVHDRPCLTALRLAVILQAQGWSGAPTACCPGCPAAAPVSRLNKPVAAAHQVRRSNRVV